MTKVNVKAQWPIVKLGSVVDFISGFPFKSELFTNKPDDIHLVKGENLHQGYIDWKNAKRWKATEFPQYERFQLNPGDVVLAMDRPWIEAGLKFSWIKTHDPKALLVQRVARMRGTNGLSTSYLRYIIGSSQFTDYIKPIVTGVNVPHISGQQIKDFEFLLPPDDIQCRIATTLSAYDNFIENNVRRIQILEEMARRIYEEWFVHFRFPGHGESRRVETMKESVPENWSIKQVSHFGKVVTGKTPSKRDNTNYGLDVAFLKLPDMHGRLFCIDTAEKLSNKGAASQSSKFIPANSLCVSCIGTAGIVNINAVECQTNQQINSLIPNEAHAREYLYFALLGLKDLINRYGANGATMVNLNKTKFESLPVIQPTEKLLKNYHQITYPLFQQILNLQRKNDVLRTTRDLLLPKLISGQLDVSNFREPE